MKFIADLHIHSQFSIATSTQLNPQFIDLWARKKGITVVGSGDAVHPGWIQLLKKQLVYTGNGLYQLKEHLKIPQAKSFSSSPFFMLTSEISCIYKSDGKVRKVHNIIAAPDFRTMGKIGRKLGAIGNITSDGRPILGIDSRDLLEIVLDAGNGAFLIPAHIWTPWFSVLGARSGFDSIELCYKDLSPYIFAVETGLSSDPPMNWSCSFLDKYTLVSNSDAHSPQKLGREATLFDTEPGFWNIADALRAKNSGSFKGTLECFPQEGKYFLDGHRKCRVRWVPEETKKHNGICPVCGKPVTTGVLNRVKQLADRNPDRVASKMPPFYSLTPLKGLLAQVTGTCAESKKTFNLYEEFLLKLGPELQILLNLPYEEIASVNAAAAHAIIQMRKGSLKREGGYDGEYGKIVIV